MSENSCAGDVLQLSFPGSAIRAVADWHRRGDLLGTVDYLRTGLHQSAIEVAGEVERVRHAPSGSDCSY